MVKQTFDLYFSEERNLKLIQTVIYGADGKAITLANALKLENPIPLIIFGFVDKNNENESQQILDLPILVQEKKLPTLIRNVGAQSVIIGGKVMQK
ncbi:hypothetical protein [Flavobacterium sp. PL12]|uniref:nucleoside-diphosphate sugar epimerase/dehydratase n=1 Tax=Flavobacterium sp. PL12 TaxID=3071718 RepID=UPI00319E0D0E